MESIVNGIAGFLQNHVVRMVVAGLKANRQVKCMTIFRVLGNEEFDSVLRIQLV